MGSIIVFPKAGPLHSSPTEWWCRARIPQGIATKDLSLLLFLTSDPSQDPDFSPGGEKSRSSGKTTSIKNEPGFQNMQDRPSPEEFFNRGSILSEKI